MVIGFWGALLALWTLLQLLFSPPAITLALLGALAALMSGAELRTWCPLLGALITACGLVTLVAEARR